MKEHSPNAGHAVPGVDGGSQLGGLGSSASEGPVDRLKFRPDGGGFDPECPTQSALTDGVSLWCGVRPVPNDPLITPERFVSVEDGPPSLRDGSERDGEFGRRLLG
jgi:hypothetical protein